MDSNSFPRWTTASIILIPVIATSCSVTASETSAGTEANATQSGDDWPQFLGPSSDSKSTERGIITDWSSGPRVVWHLPLGPSYGSCSISRGRCFVFDRVPDSTKARARCVDSKSGEFIWDYHYPTAFEDLYEYNNGPRCCPVVDDDRVYLYGAEGRLTCLNATDGQLVWELDVQDEFGVVQNFFGVGSAPVVFGPLLLVMVGGSPADSHDLPPGALEQVEGNGSGVVAFDKLTGEVRYQLCDELASYSTIRIVKHLDRDWGFAFLRGGLVAFDPRSGQQDFAYPWRARILESVNASTPVIVGNQVFISETYGPGSSLLEFDTDGFKVVWKDGNQVRDKAMQTHWNTAIHHNGFLYGSSGRHTQNAELRCVDWKTGDVRWSQPGLSRASLLYVDEHFICLGEYGILLLIAADPDEYRKVAATRITLENQDKSMLEYPAWAAPILSHGLLYVRGNDKLVCLELIRQ